MLRLKFKFVVVVMAVYLTFLGLGLILATWAKEHSYGSLVLSSLSVVGVHDGDTFNVTIPGGLS